MGTDRNNNIPIPRYPPSPWVDRGGAVNTGSVAVLERARNCHCLTAPAVTRLFFWGFPRSRATIRCRGERPRLFPCRRRPTAGDVMYGFTWRAVWRCKPDARSGRACISACRACLESPACPGCLAREGQWGVCKVPGELKFMRRGSSASHSSAMAPSCCQRRRGLRSPDCQADSMAG